jgi:hypothetical protein
MAQVNTQVQNKLTRFAGPSMIKDVDHMSGIPQVQDENNTNGRQAQQGQSGRLAKNSKDGRAFEYQNPRQYT